MPGPAGSKPEPACRREAPRTAALTTYLRSGFPSGQRNGGLNNRSVDSERHCASHAEREWMAKGISYFRGPWPRSPGGVTVSLYAGEETETANDRNGLCQRLLERFAIRWSWGECNQQGTSGQGMMNVSSANTAHFQIVRLAGGPAAAGPVRSVWCCWPVVERYYARDLQL